LTGLNSTLNVTNTAPTVFTGVIQYSALNAGKALTKTGGGLVILTGTNTYTGQTNILGGIVNVQNAAALGATPDQPLLTALTNASTVPVAGTLIGSGATLQLQGGITVSEALAINGGTLESVTGANFFGGSINMLASSTIQVDAGTLTVTGQIAGTAD